LVTEAPATPSEQPVIAPTLAPDAWRSLPVIPESLDPRAIAIFQRGLELGNNPKAFSKVGDCGATPAWFLGDFDRGPQFYRLGDYAALQPIIENYSGFTAGKPGRERGFTAASVFAIVADRSQCLAGETPIACEYRIQKPSLAFIMLGTNDVWHKDSFEPQMRKIIEFSIENGVIPILSTKADDREGDGSLNATLAQLSIEYGIPLWNYWSAVQGLPNGGLQEDEAHITWAPNRFDDPLVMQEAGRSEFMPCKCIDLRQLRTK
jgi:hypothetical protein